MKLQNRQAFTLVELIVVITILAILWTIAFISLQWFSKDARNSSRASDLKNIEKVLSLYQLRESQFPLPSNEVEITYSWAEVWTQWTFWEDTRKLLGSQGQISNVPLDPLTWSEYTYSRLNTKNEFQLAAVFEWDLSNNNILNETYADWVYWTTKITWNYNGQVAKTSTWWTTYILAVPSIISWDISLTRVTDILNARKLMYNWFHNLPSSYSWTTNFDDIVITWNIVNTGSLVVYETNDINDLLIEFNQNILINELQSAYVWTIIEEEDWIEEIVNITDWNKIYVAQIIIKNSIITDFVVSADNYTCMNMTETQLSALNTFYQEGDMYAYTSVNPRVRYDPDTQYELTKFEWCNNVVSIEELRNGSSVDIIPQDLIPVYNSMDKLETFYYFNSNNIISKQLELAQLNNLYLYITILPSEIFSFTNLKGLYLHDNTILTTISPEIWNLTNLIYLWFRNNKITSVPSEIITLTKLTSLTLSHFDLTSIPPEVYNLNNLTELWLGHNKITSVPSEIFTLTNLKWLWFLSNKLTTIPPEIWNLTNLQRLWFAENQITSVPSELWTLTNLKDLYLNVNQITTIPPELWNLTNLERLQLGSNQLTDVPSELWTLIKLKWLYLYNNQLTSISSEIWNLINLERRLNLSNNQLTTLPSEIWNLTNKLQWLNLAWNSWFWELNLDFGNTADSKTQTNITPDWKTITIAWNWTTVGITVTNP